MPGGDPDSPRGGRASTVLKRFCAALLAPTSCLGCCSLRVGILLLALVCFINAVLGFAGLTVLVFDVESLASMRASAGSMLPPGVDVGDPRLKVVVYFCSFYFLTLATAGSYSALARSALAAMLSYGCILALVAAAVVVVIAAGAMGAQSIAVMYVCLLVPLVYSAALTRSWMRLLLGAVGYTQTPDFGADV